MTKKRKNAAFIAACLFPSLILLLIFVIYPTVSIFNVSLFKWGGYSATRTFVGLENYRILLTDQRFFNSLKNSLLLIIVVSSITLVLSLFCAEVLSRERLRGKTFFRIVLYIPNILSTVVIAAVFSAIYDPKSGLLNSLTKESILWLGDRSLVIYSVAIAMIWQAVGYYMIMYMSSMAQVPKSLYDP